MHEGPLTDFVPAAGLRWMIVARPAELHRDEDLRALLAPLLPKPRVDAFEMATGIDLRTAPQALVAAFDFAMLYVVATPGDNERVERRFQERLLTEPRRWDPHPRIVRLTGLSGTKPETLVRVESQLVAFSVGDPVPARVVELYALDRLRKTPPALRGSALRHLPSALGDAPVAAYAPGPFGGEWARGARGLLAGALAVGASLRPVGRVGQLRVVLSGEFDAVDATSRLEDSWSDLAFSPLGRLLGLTEPVAPLSIEVHADRVELAVQLDLVPLVRGLRAAVIADIWEIMDFAPPKSDAPHPG